MNIPKALKLKLVGASRPDILQFKVNTAEKDYYNSALEKLNDISILNFTMSDFQRMALEDLSDRILQGVVKISVDIPNRRITFDLEPTKRKVIPKSDNV